MEKAKEDGEEGGKVWQGIHRKREERGWRIRERKGIEVHGRGIEVEKREESEKTQ